MKKLLTTFTLSLFVQLTFGQNEQLIKEIEKYIFEIDSLMECCHEKILSQHSHSSEWLDYSYYKNKSDYHCHWVILDSMIKDKDNDKWRQEIEKFNNSFVNPIKEISTSNDELVRILDKYGYKRTIIEKYYQQNTKLVAIKKRTILRAVRENESDDELAKTILYINDGKIIYREGENENIDFLIQKYNLK
jgi:hypothetical protein